MLKLFRNKNVAKLVLWGLLILIMPAFVLWGTGNLGGGKNKGPKFAGTIDDKNISFEDFYKSVVSVRCQVILNYFNQPKLLDAYLANKELMGKLSWDRLIMAKEAKKAGIRIPDDEVIQFVKSHPIFLRNGQFDDKMYGYILRNSMGTDPRTFEEIVRSNLAIQKLNDMVVKDVTVSDEEVLEEYKKENQKFRLTCLVFAAENFKDKAAIDDAAIKNFYEVNKDRFAGTGTDGQPGTAAFEDVKENIKTYLVAAEARRLALAQADAEYKSIKELMAKGGTTFEQAVAARGLAAKDVPFFSRGDYLDGIGEAFPLTDEVVKLKIGEVSAPVEVRTGAVICTVADVQNYDEGKFKTEKPDFSKKVLEQKKMFILEDWLRQLELTNKANIELGEYDKYLR